jgi:hypothetical protein
MALFKSARLPPAEAWIRFPAGTCQSWDLQFRTEMTLVKSLHSGDPNVIWNTWTCKASVRHQTIFLASVFAVHACSCNTCTGRSQVFKKISLALQTRSDLCIPINETAKPRFPFPHSCICERFIYSHDRSAYFAAFCKIGGTIVGIYKSLTDTCM